MKIIDSYPDEHRVIAVQQRGEYVRVGDYFRDPESGIVLVATKIDGTLVDCMYEMRCLKIRGKTA